MAREADLRYTPLCKDLKDVVCFSAEKEVLVKILSNYLYEEGKE